MKKTFFATLGLLAMSAMSAFGGQWTGYISDSHCAAKHNDGSDASIACVKKCVKGGAPAVFITSDDKVLKIDAASQAKVMKHLGHKVTIDGNLDGDTLTVTSVTM